jgi:hypothetical protein
MTPQRIVSRVEDYREGDLLLADPLVAPAGANVLCPKAAGDLTMLIFALFGNNRSGCTLANTPFLIDGLTADQQTEVLDAVSSIAQQWGTSVIDSAHGIVNCIRNAKTLLNKPRLRAPITSMPVIAVGAGPSTTAAIDSLRYLSRRMIVVAADAALRPLQKAGVEVHACTPLERLTSTAQKTEGQDSPLTVFCGSPFVPPAAVNAFQQHLLWTPPDPLMDWFTGEEVPYDYLPGTTSGTSAIAVALKITSGPVYLVGHDLCGGHMAGASVSASLADDFDSVRMGNDRTMKPTKMAWLRAKADIELMDVKRLINAGGAMGYGLELNGIQREALPLYAGWTDDTGLIAACEADESMGIERLRGFKDKVRLLPSDLENAAYLAKDATCLEHLALERLCTRENRDCMGYLLRSLYAQASLEKRLGRPVDQVITMFTGALRSVVDTMAQPFREVCRDY